MNKKLLLIGIGLLVIVGFIFKKGEKKAIVNNEMTVIEHNDSKIVFSTKIVPKDIEKIDKNETHDEEKIKSLVDEVSVGYQELVEKSNPKPVDEAYVATNELENNILENANRVIEKQSKKITSTFLLLIRESMKETYKISTNDKKPVDEAMSTESENVRYSKPQDINNLICKSAKDVNSTDDLDELKECLSYDQSYVKDKKYFEIYFKSITDNLLCKAMNSLREKLDKDSSSRKSIEMLVYHCTLGLNKRLMYINDFERSFKEKNIKAPKDTIKGGDKLKDDYNGENISLTDIEKVYEIKRENLHFPPYRCFVYHSEDKQTEIGISNGSTIEFKIDKSLLSVGDIILVLNSQNVKSKTNPFGKFVIEEIMITP